VNQTFDEWVHALEARHLADLTFAEVSRALRALSSTYVENRGGLLEGRALKGAGKRAAFALFYGPLHFLLLQHIVRSLGVFERSSVAAIVDLGCGTGAAGAAVAGLCQRQPRVLGIDRHPWPVKEAALTYRHFGLNGRAVRGDITGAHWPDPPAALIASFTLNELDEKARAVMLRRLLERASRHDPVLIVEPLARFVAPWWFEWQAVFSKAGGRADEWRFKVDLPPIVQRLDRAAGLDHRELTGRSLYVP
jgi:SAM-dependent methyltransferase